MIFDTLLARENWRTKYKYGDEEPLETFVRVAQEIAEVESEYGASKDEVEEKFEEFLHTLVKLEKEADADPSEDDVIDLSDGTYRATGLNATPGGRITANAGTDYDETTLWNCFINSPVSDAKIEYDKPVPNSEEEIEVLMESEQTPDNLTNIFLSLLEAAETLKSEGGYGINFGFIRPRGTLIEGVGIRHPGVVSYMEMWDKMSEIIVKGDSDGYEDDLTNHLEDPEDTANKLEKAMPRKGAMLAALPVWHPDIEEYIRSKQQSGRLTKFNISVLIDDEFMRTVENDDFYDLHFDGKTYKKVRARELYDLIMESTYCVPGETEIPVKKGNNEIEMTSVEDLYDSDYGDTEALSHNPFDLKQGENQIEDVIKTGEKATIELHTRSGTIECTPNHTLFGVEEGDQFKEKLAKEFDTGDWIAVSDKLGFDEDELREDALDSEMATFAGIVMGDGNVRKNSKTIRLYSHKGDASYLNPYLEYLKEGYDVNVKQYERDGEDCLYTSIHSSDLWSLFRYDFEMGSGDEKQVPREILNSNSTKTIKNFLAGFYAADGFTSEKKTHMYSSRRSIAEDIQKLFLRIGIRSTISKSIKETESGNYVGWQVTLRKQGSKKFQNEVDIPLDRKNFVVKASRSEDIFPIRCDEFDTNRYTNKYDIWERNGETHHSNMTSEVGDKLKDGDVVYEKIESITFSSEGKEVYDISMKADENFVDSQGFIYHNCRNEPGVLYFDNLNRCNPLLYLGPDASANPCLAEGTKVATKEGLRPVEDIEEGDLIQTTLGFDPVEEIEVHEDKPVYKVEFSDGITLRATEDHIFHVMQGSNCRKTWDNETRLKNLEEDDFVRKEPYRFETGNRSDLTRNDGFLAGYWLGDGCRNEMNRFILSANSSEDNSYLREALEKIGFTYHEDHSSEGNAMHFRVQSEADVMAFVEKTGLDLECYSHEKSMPEWWINSNPQFLAGVVDGLISADGNVNLSGRYAALRLKTCSVDLADGFRELCLRIGSDCKKYLAHEEGTTREIYGGEVERKNDTYELHLTNDCIENLYRFVGELSHPEKNQDLQTILTEKQLTGTKWKVKIDSIEEDGTATVYDLYEPKADDWNTHGIVSRGCGEIPGSTFVDKHYDAEPYLEEYLDDDDEHHLGFTTVCLLGSINLTQFVNEDRTFDWDSYRETISTFARMLENVNDIDMAPLPSYRWAIEKIRQYGMGINGLGSTLYMLGIKYGSDEAVEFTEKVNGLKDELTMKESALLAKERGPFPMYDERYLETPYFQDHCKTSDEVKELVREHGIRNAKRLTNPPLGSSSVICDNVSNGIEPVFMHDYERTVIADDWPDGLNRDNVEDKLDKVQVGDATAWRGEYKGDVWYWEPHNRGLCFIETVRDYGYGWVKEHYPEDVEEDADYLATSETLDIDAHVRMQEVVQDHVDQAVSKTSNLPNDYPFEDFKSLYKDAWEAGLVGFTTYRAGTMETVLDEKEEEQTDEEKFGSLLDLYIDRGCVPTDVSMTEDDVIVRDVNLPNEFSNGKTRKVQADGNKYYIHLSYLPDDDRYPVAFWVHSNELEDKEYVSLNRAVKSVTKLLINMGVDMDIVLDYRDKISDDAHHARLGKMISMALRHNIGLPNIVSSIEDIEGDYIASTLTAVRKFLKERIEDGTKVRGASCSSCGSENIVYESGCSRCLDCGESKCGGV